MGPGKADLLAAIIETGSISKAAQALSMSYRRAWMLVDVMNHSFKEPLVLAARGGKRGGGAEVTPLGREALKRFHAMEAKAAADLAGEMANFEKLLK